jgi:hypothetical protein
MWPVAIFLMIVVLFYWFAFCLTVAAGFKTIIHLCQGNFTRAAAWFAVGCGMLAWWQGTEVIPHPWDFDAWLRASAWIVGFGALLTFIRFCHRQRQRRAVEAAPPFEPAPVVLNINIELSPHADRRAAHDDLVALASVLRDAIGTKQGPRRISGPTIIDQ